LEESLKQRAQANRVCDRVEWCPWTSAIWQEYEGADAFVMASRYEGFPQSLVEAISTGLPCVIVDCSPAIRQCVVHEESALVVSKVDDLPRVMQRLLSDDSLRRRLSQGAMEASRSFQWEVVAPRWEQAIAIASRSGRF
jgi:GalNAc-alpha-(1->4)-GalNAc-alpha-(1->3)-diNAcBac-PP-undecaprenol alpha-1,4-N-acetyl-D-galactosaminyltransferase